MIVIYGIPNCDKCRAANKWFSAQGAEFRFHDVRSDGLQSAALDNWLQELGEDTLLNRRSTTWRQLSDTEREADAAELILQHPTLLKRPLVDTGAGLIVGYDEGAWQKALD
ncbi:MAG: Spx/MgsR family RNA polymerase-binding regulatory protein [Gammaproteobacteria bacterium]|nr:Spx/MgsR family RNA polymerase-binding regulatory protein [Gammaproteobacteria bacterium]NND54480.1 Spx/MgsR family RNA polymerase-binding regulatory protein [Gammaproteobacteria bacterium]